jgi:pyruvate,water dikinase
MAELIAFPGSSEASVAAAGGKGAALVRMAAAGLPVPAGVVLPVDFFAPWVAAVQASAAWDALVAGGPEHWEERCPAVEALAVGLAADGAQDDVLDAIVEKVRGWGLVAVRSSSPEEDLVTASFAGGYTTVLGVGPEGLLAAVRRCFASALAARVLHYKRAHGFDPLQPRIAVVVQRQLASAYAGVGFSLNPQNNDHDEAVFDACWGLGEVVVAGLSTPDHVVVQRVEGRVLEHRLGAKQRSLWLGDDGGVVEREGHRSGERCLDEARISELAGLIGAVEDWLGRPVDIEWAVAEGRLWLLQARPVTTHLPLPPALMTAPGERRWLYMDASLSNGLTLNTAVSPLGLDWLTEIFTQLLERFVGLLLRVAPLKE